MLVSLNPSGKFTSHQSALDAAVALGHGRILRPAEEKP